MMHDWANYLSTAMGVQGEKIKTVKRYDGDIAKFTLIRRSEQEPEYKNQKGVGGDHKMLYASALYMK